MSTTTTNYNLTKPANGEFIDTWDVPVNGNWDIIDNEMKGIQDDLDAHKALDTDPHGEVLTQTTLNVAHGASDPGNAIDITNDSANMDIDGTNSSWNVDRDGNAQFSTVQAGSGSPIETLSFSREEKLGSDGTGLGNREFELTNAYVMGDNSLSIYVEGVLQIEGISRDYEEIDNTNIRFTYDIGSADKVTFMIGRQTNDSFGNVQTFTAAGGETIIPTTFLYVIAANQIDVFKDGLLQIKDVDYSESGQNEVTFLSPLSASEVVVIRQARDQLASAHAQLHEAGGSDEISLTDLRVGAPGEGIILIAPDGNEWRLTVDNAGSPVFTLV